MKSAALLHGAAFTALLLSRGAAQPTLNVPSPQYPTIQLAINAAPPGGIILVAPGTWSGSLNFLGKAITVRGVQGAALTTIAGSPTSRVVTFAGGEGPASVLDGFTVSGGAGGIICQNSSPTIMNCRINGNAASVLGPYGNGQPPSSTGAGGGICCVATTGSASPTISNCRIESNLATVGGGIYCVATAPGISQPFLNNSRVSANLAFPSVYGVVSGTGGGAWFNGASPTIVASVFRGNTAAAIAGGIIGTGTTLSMQSSEVSHNHSGPTNSNQGSYGGGLSLSVAQVEMKNCLIHGNSAVGDGGAMNVSGTGTIQECTIAGNTTQSTVGGILVSGIISFRNCIVWGNSNIDILRDPAAGPGSIPSVTYSDVGWSIGVSIGFGTITADPRFVDSASGDYHIASSSPCRNAGSPGPAGLATTDLDGTPRLVGGTVDMGSDEVPALALTGTNEDLDLFAWVQGARDPLASIVTAPASTLVTVRLQSAGGTYSGVWPLVLAQAHPTGVPVPPNPGFGDIHVFFGGPFVQVYGSLTPPLFPSPGLPAGGAEFVFQVPPGLSGSSVRLQGFAITPTAANGLYASTAGKDIDFP